MSLAKISRPKKITELSAEVAKELQTLLNKHGFSLAVDGIVGEKTLKAFNDFKAGNHLGYPNMIGQSTIAKLIDTPDERTINREGLELIKHFEGFRSNAYLCPANVWTIGYGSTFYPDGRKVKAGDHVTRAEGEELLRNTVKRFEQGVDRMVKVKLNSNQFSALVSFAFNVGLGAFSKSTLLRVLNQGNYAEAYRQFGRWTRGGGRVLAGLVRRRKAEKALFNK